MEKRIELERRGNPPDQIKDLNLDNCRATQIEGLTDDFCNLESLSLINVGLTTLKGFPELANLRKLELSDNRISGGLNNLSGCPKLAYLNLSGNKIKDFETLEPLKNFSELKNLDLFNCEVTSVDNYREKVFEIVEGLQFLDGFDRNNQEADDEDEDGDDVDGEEDDDDDDVEGSDDLDEDDDDEDGVVDVDDEEGEDDDGEGDDDDEADDDDDDEEEVGLSYLEKEEISDDEDGADFEPGSGGVEDEEGEEDEDEEAEDDDDARGVKRKHEEDEEGA